MARAAVCAAEPTVGPLLPSGLPEGLLRSSALVLEVVHLSHTWLTSTHSLLYQEKPCLPQFCKPGPARPLTCWLSAPQKSPSTLMLREML